jgi:nucleoid-associated protein YgaU
MAAKQSKTEKNIIFEDEKNISTQQEDVSDSKPSTVENIISIILGLAVVFVIGAMIVNVIRNRSAQETTSREEKERQEQQAAKEATISARYTVQAGDTLWSIAQKHYNDGFKYTEILKANNMTEKTPLEKGTELIIPKIEGVVAAATPTVNPQATDTVVPSPTTASLSGPTGPTGAQVDGQASSASTDRQYTVVKGDNLWNIAVQKYNNGYRWAEIARINNLKNPDLIHPGNVLIMPE